MEILTKIDIKLREHLNPYIAPFRLRKIAQLGGDPSSTFTIISNNCWGGHVYRYFNLPYASPTIGLYFFSDDYLRFVSSLEFYLNSDLKMIKLEESKHYEEIKKNHQDSINAPIGVINDIEIVFLHYKSPEEAQNKWNRRKTRVNMNNIIVKNSEQNGCTIKHLKAFDNIPIGKKFVFVTRDYNLKSQIIVKDYVCQTTITDDTSKFRKYIDLEKLISGKPFTLNQ